MIHIRDATTKDLNFITSSWAQSYYPQCGLGFEDYKHYQNILINNIITNSINTIACDEQDHDHIFGYIIHDMYMNEPVIHYTYVKALYRRMGIAKALMNEVLGNDHEYYIYTHRPEKISILKALTFVSGEYNEHLKYREFYEKA
jgi:GNAT superfamily N-acetyltransferase